MMLWAPEKFAFIMDLFSCECIFVIENKAEYKEDYS